MVKINQEMVLNWFGLQDQQIQTFPESINNWSLNEGNITVSSDLSLEAFRIIVQSLWNKYSSGLSLTDIEEILFVIAFIRFLIIAVCCVGCIHWCMHHIGCIFPYPRIPTEA